MLLQRVLVVLILLPIGIALIFLGGIWFALAVSLILGLAGWEFAGIFRRGGHEASGFLVVIGILLLVWGRYSGNAELEAGLMVLSVLAAMTYHLVQYERGRDGAAVDFAVTLAGILYVGGLGAYFVSLRELEAGAWWVLLVLPAIWLADSGAYFIGRRFGKRKLSPRLSPKKTWEGYLGGLFVGIAGTVLLGYLWNLVGSPEFEISPLQSALLGGVLAAVTTLGDLGESMIKRQFGVKDSGNILPGHGGAFDRIDSWLWGAPIGYFIIVAWIVA
jgi:phosphatidate cytidylyltransferase